MKSTLTLQSLLSCWKFCTENLGKLVSAPSYLLSEKLTNLVSVSSLMFWTNSLSAKTDVRHVEPPEFH